jgi:hypothetical protein
MKDQYVDISPELLGKTDPDQQWIAAQLDRIAPWRFEQGHDGAETAALRKLVLELRSKLATTQPETGGPAFPSGLIDPSTPEDAVHPIHVGMTLRDHFAAHAPITLDDAVQFLDTYGGEVVGPWPPEKVLQTLADLRVEYADAMLKARGGAA